MFEFPLGQWKVEPVHSQHLLWDGSVLLSSDGWFICQLSKIISKVVSITLFWTAGNFQQNIFILDSKCPFKVK